MDEKLEAIGMEYSYLLTSQLESQRHFYEDKLDQFQAQLTSLTGDLSNLTAKAAQIDSLSSRTAELERTNEILRKDKDKAERKAEKAVVSPSFRLCIGDDVSGGKSDAEKRDWEDKEGDGDSSCGKAVWPTIQQVEDGSYMIHM